MVRKISFPRNSLILWTTRFFLQRCHGEPHVVGAPFSNSPQNVSLDAEMH